MDNDFSVSAAALEQLRESSFELQKLKLSVLHSLQRVLGVGKGVGNNKSDAIKLLHDNFGTITKEQFQSLVTKVQRGVAQVALLPTGRPP